MENPIFRKKNIERVSSPEQLNDYIRVTSPGVWIVLFAVLLLLAGFIVWGTVGKLETKLNVVAVSAGEEVVCYVRMEDISKVETGDAVRVGNEEFSIAAIASEPVEVDDGFSAYTLRVGGLEKGEWVYRATLRAELPAGVYAGAIVTDSVSPISFLFH